MGSYRIEFKRSAEQDIRKIGAALIPRILRRIEALSDDPFPRQSLKLTGTEDSHRLRVGNYRVIYSVDMGTETIIVHYVRHRREVYRRL